MAQKAIDEVTLVDVTDGETGVSVDSITSFYYLGTDTTPSQPTTLSPPDPWTSIEPRYQENRTLYRSERTLYKDGTFAYSQVQTDSAYAAAADAYNKSMQVSSDLTAYINAMKIVTDDMQSQIDGAITTWFKPYAPTDDQLPTTDWNTTDLKNNHLGDLFYNTITGYVYRYQVQNNVYSWQRISDNDVVKAMEDAAKAQDTADSKRQVFVVTPTTPYDIGDLWVQGSGGDIMKCRIAKAETQSYSGDDWVVASKYTDDTTANAAKQAATVAANKITISDHIPTASDSVNKANGSVWEVRSGETVLSRYVLNSANTWKQVKVGQDFIGENAISTAQIASLDVSRLSAGTADMQAATIAKIAAQIIQSRLFQTSDANPKNYIDPDGFHATDANGNEIFDVSDGVVKSLGMIAKDIQASGKFTAGDGHTQISLEQKHPSGSGYTNTVSFGSAMSGSGLVSIERWISEDETQSKFNIMFDAGYILTRGKTSGDASQGLDPKVSFNSYGLMDIFAADLLRIISNTGMEIRATKDITINGASLYLSTKYAYINGMYFVSSESTLSSITPGEGTKAILGGKDEYVYKNSAWVKIPKVPIAGTAFNCDSNSTSWEASFANVTTSDGDAPLTLGTYNSKKGILIPESGYYEIWGMLNLRVSTTKLVKAAVGRPNQDWQYIGYYTNIDFGMLPNGWCMTPFVKTIVYLLKGDILTLRLVDGGNGSFTWGTQTRLDIQYLHP